MQPDTAPEPVLGRAHILQGRDERYRQFCTDWQWEMLETVWKLKTLQGAADALNRSRSTIRRTIDYVAGKASVGGYAPNHGLTTPMAPGYVGRGHSSLYKVNPETGDKMLVLQWEKTKADEEMRRRAMETWLAAAASEVPALPPMAAPTGWFDEDLLTIYPQGDPHAGMYSWQDETGAHFDLVEFERVTKAAIDRLVQSAPPSKVAIYNDKGDLTHADNSKNRTPASGHELDVHGRHRQVVEIAVRCKRHHISRMLEKHEKVILRIDPGNHDRETALLIAMIMQAWYENEPRVEVITSPNPYWYYLWGRNLIGTCHGDGAKGKDLPLIMATDAREWWGQAEFCLWLVGHVHHKDIKEYAGCTVEYLRTLAPADYHAHKSGYRSKRDMQAITLHKLHGEVARQTCSYSMICDDEKADRNL